MSKFVPILDRIIVKPEEAITKTEGGIIIPETAKEVPQKGIVTKAGPGYKDDPVSVKEGMTVHYAKKSGVEIELEGETHLIMRDKDIYGYEE